MTNPSDPKTSKDKEQPQKEQAMQQGGGQQMLASTTQPHTENPDTAETHAAPSLLPELVFLYVPKTRSGALTRGGQTMQLSQAEMAGLFALNGLTRGRESSQ